MSQQLQLITTPLTHDFVRGAVELEQTEHGILPHRLPLWARTQWPDQQLAMTESQPSGVRVVFRTHATIIILDSLATKRIYKGMSPRPDGVYDLRINGQLVRQARVEGGRTLRIDMATGSMTTETGAPGSVQFDDLAEGQKNIEIWLPHDETTELIALHTNAPVEPVADKDLKTWVHHGSSISHGSNATSPTGTWPAIAASLSGVALMNLGFGGSALLDPFMARTMRDLPADMISIKLGINLVNTDLMRVRAFGPAAHGFLDTIREGHPTTPLLIVSPVLCPIHEQVPGPSAPDFSTGQLRFQAAGDAAEIANGKLTLGIIRDVLAEIVAQRSLTDPNIHYLDGRELFGEADHANLPLPDNLHPDAETHRLIGERFAKLAFVPTGPMG